MQGDPPGEWADHINFFFRIGLEDEIKAEFKSGLIIGLEKAEPA